MNIPIEKLGTINTIGEVDGIDALFVGCAGDYHSPRVVAALDAVCATGRAVGRQRG